MPAARREHREPPHAAWLNELCVIVEGLEDGKVKAGEADSCEREPPQEWRGGGRGVFVAKGVGPVRAGTLLLEELPLLQAPNVVTLERKVRDLDVAPGRGGGTEEDDIRRALASMYAGPGLAAGEVPLTRRAEGIIEHNYHCAEPLPMEGSTAGAGPVGLYPTGSLVNHYFLRPNVGRCFVPGTRALQFRAIRELQPGEELMDNYCDLCLPHAVRARIMNDQHSVPEARDALDAAPELLATVASARERADAICNADGAQQARQKLQVLQPTQERILAGIASGPADPALAPFFEDFASACMDVGSGDLAVSAWETALGLVCGREPYSFRSVMLCARSALAACRAACSVAEASGESRALAERWFKEAIKHWNVVFGCNRRAAATFDSRHPALCALATQLGFDFPAVDIVSEESGQVVAPPPLLCKRKFVEVDFGAEKVADDDEAWDLFG